MTTVPRAAPRRQERLTHRAILAIAVPIMISNVSTPLLGIVDTGVVGQIPDPAYIGAVALGALVFNFVFWGFGFLRMGTTGLTAQALGAGDATEIRASLGRAALIALAVGVGADRAAVADPRARFLPDRGQRAGRGLARTYYDIRIWAAPATLLNYALLGWFIGLGRARMALALQLVLNVTNMALDALFVLGMGLGVEGVAPGNAAGRDGGGRRRARNRRTAPAQAGWPVGPRAAQGGRSACARTIAVNRDIMIRSAALIVAFAWFMAQSATPGRHDPGRRTQC